MNNEEAKFILQAYRGSGQDANDPQFQEALEQAARDPELAAWLAEERDVDNAISAKLETILPPPELKSSILAARKVIQPNVGWNMRRTLSWVAAVVVVATIALFWKPQSQQANLATYRSEMIAWMPDGMANGLDGYYPTVSEIRTHFAGVRRSLADFELLPGLRNRATVGCKLIPWEGTQVALICFENGQSEVMHLFVISSTDLDGGPLLDGPVLADEAGWSTALWSQNDKYYLLAAHRGQANLKSLIDDVDMVGL